MKDVLFLVMPFGGVERPQVGISTLKAQLLNNGYGCDIKYFNIEFAKFVGYQDYSWITHNYSYELFAGEWLFARALFTDSEINYQGYVEDILFRQGQFTPPMMQRLLRMGEYVEYFLEQCLATVDWEKYSIVGFTTTFEQNLASLCLAKRLKQRFPHIPIAFGGGNCSGVMGVQLHRSFSFLDFVFTGEADFAFPELVHRLHIDDLKRDDLVNCVWRENGESMQGQGAAAPLANLDAIAYPIYDDFFWQFAASGLRREVVPQIQIETSRGCWWGERSQCTFCGLNRDEITFRQKSPMRIINEILHLITRYDSTYLSAVDNIMGMDYFKTVLPELKRRNLGLRIFFETKANLTREQVRLLGESGVVDIQPGIESFSNNTLKLMHKGISDLQNVKLLKWCSCYGVYPSWNLLYCFPGETREDYECNIRFAEALSHLTPPDGCGALRLDRFSDYFNNPEAHGIRLLGPMNAYRYLYPLAQEALDNIGYFFEFDFDGYAKSDEWATNLHAEIDRWKHYHNSSRLEIVHDTGEAIFVHDTRYNSARREFRFQNPEKSIINFCDDPKTYETIAEYTTSLGVKEFTKEHLDAFLDYMVKHRLMLTSEGRYLSLILPGAAAT